MGAAILLLAASSIQAQPSILGSNLVVNGGAETGPAATGVSHAVASIPGWTATGSANVLPYNLTGLLQNTNPAPPDHGFQYFVAGTFNTTITQTSTLTQDIDVSAAAATINAGTAKFIASAYLGNAINYYPGSAQVAFAFKNTAGQTFSTATLGPESPGGTVAALELEKQVGIVPPGTTRVTVTITLTEFDARAYGAADSVSLVLQTLGTTPATVLGPNLVSNPGAEDGPGAPTNSTASDIPGWSRTGGAAVAPASVAPYGGTNWVQASDPGPSGRGVNLFWGIANSNLYQDLDVSDAATSIDSGKVTYQVSAWLGALFSQGTPMLTYTFFDWSGKQLASTAQLGPVAHSVTGLVIASHSDNLPAGTRRVHLVLSFPSAAASFADNISFTLAPAGSPVIAPGGVVPVFSSSTVLEPGSWGSIYGTNLAGTTTSWNGDFPVSLGGTSVTVNSKPAYLWFVSPTQINFQVPDDSATGTVNVVVTTPVGSATSTITLGAYGPSFSLYNAKYAAAIVITPGKAGNSNLGFDYIGPAGGLPFTSRPVKAGETLVLYGVGFGPTSPPVLAGATYSGAAPCLTTPQVTIGGVTATVIFAGVVQAGLYQMNIVVPNAGAGDRMLQAMVGGVTTPANVFVTLQ